jgi:hypothetical protein
MAITVKCGACQKQFQVRDGLAGKSVVCKECGADLPVPKSPSGTSADADAASAGEYAVSGRSTAPSTAAQSRRSRASTAEPVLSRRSSESGSLGRSGAPGNQQAVWIYLGAGGLLLALVVVVIKLVGSPPAAPEAELNRSRPPARTSAPPPVYSPAATNEASEKPVVQRKPEKSPGKTSEPKADVKVTGTRPQREATRAGAVEESEEGGIEIGHGERAWRVKVDPPAEPFEIDPNKKILATIPKNSAGDVIFPDCPSSIVAVGSNHTPREIREVRDVQGNRRLGSVRNSVIANARLALSPDGQQFAAWPAGQNRIGVWTVKTEMPRGMIPVSGVSVPRLLMFAGNERLIALGGGEELFVWTMPDGVLYGTVALPKITGAVVAGLSPGGRYLALAVADPKKPSLRVFDLIAGNVAGEITFSGLAAEAPVCHAVAFSPDGAELAALYEEPEESNLFVFHVADGELAVQIATDESLRILLNAGNWQGGRALEWFPGRQRWLVYGRGVVDRSAGELVWSLPRDKSGAMPIGHVLDDDRLLVIGTEKQDAAVVAREVPSR